jgi:hypothetical protein
MTKKMLVAVSADADALDVVVIGQLPGLSWFIDAPVLAMHFMYAGPKALPTLLELVPVVGTIPLFTIAALSYPDKDTSSVSTGGTVSRLH